jgi:hypothetical protein
LVQGARQRLPNAHQRRAARLRSVAVISSQRILTIWAAKAKCFEQKKNLSPAATTLCGSPTSSILNDVGQMAVPR